MLNAVASNWAGVAVAVFISMMVVPWVVSYFVENSYFGSTERGLLTLRVLSGIMAVGTALFLLVHFYFGVYHG